MTHNTINRHTVISKQLITFIVLLSLCFLPTSCKSVDDESNYPLFISITLTNISDTPLVYETSLPINGDLNGPHASGILHKDETGVLFDGVLIHNDSFGMPSPTISYLYDQPQFHFSERKVMIYDYSPDEPDGKGILRVNCDLLDLSYVTQLVCSERKEKSNIFYSIVFQWNNPAKYTY